MDGSDGSISPVSPSDNSTRSATPPLTSVTTNTGCPLKKAIVSEGGKKTRVVPLDKDDGDLLYNKGTSNSNIDSLC